MAMPPPPPPPGQGPPPPPPPAGGGFVSPPPPGAVTTAVPGMPSGQPYYQPAHQPAAAFGGQRAGFGIRLGGYLLDGLLYGLLALVFVIPAIVLGIGAFSDCTWIEDDPVNEFVLECPPGSPSAGMLTAAGALLVFGWLLVAFIYVRALGKTGQTWGRRIVGIKVIGEQTGAPIGFGRALGRQLFAGVISSNIFYLGYLWMLWDDKQQTWQDKVVGSIVVKT